MDLEPAHLRSLQAIVRYGGFHRAAEALHLTQPAVSRHVRRLEAQLGAALFARDGRASRLTEFGERAVAELEEVLAAHDRALSVLLGEAERPFVLGTVEHLADPILPGLLAVLREQLSGRDVQVTVDRAATLAAAVGRGEVDAAITLAPGEIEDPIHLGPLPLRWWRAASDPEADLLAGPVRVVVYTEPCTMRELAQDRLAALGARPVLGAESPHMAGVHAAVRAGLGIALLSQGADGLVPLRRGPLAESIDTPIWLLVAERHRGLRAPLRAAVWRALQNATRAGAA